MGYLYRLKRGSIPWGYEECPDDPQLLKPIPELLDVLEEAKVYIDGCSLREIARWITEKTGVYISFVTVREKLVLEEQYDTRSTASQAEIDENRSFITTKKTRVLSGRTKAQYRRNIAKARRVRSKNAREARRLKERKKGYKSRKRILIPGRIREAERISRRAARECTDNIQAERGATESIPVSV